MNKITRLSIAAGLVGCCGILGGAAAQENRPAIQNPPSQGKFAIYFGPFARADVFLVDTETGRVWSQVTYTDVVGDPKVWLFQTRIDNEAELFTWVGNQTMKASAKPQQK